MKKLGGWILSFLFLGCASQPTQTKTSDLLFPLGTYEQRIVLTPVSKNLNPQAFRGILSIEKEKVQVVGLSPFGTTVFHIVEDRIANKVKTDIYMEELRPMEARIKEYYLLMRRVLVAKGRPSSILIPASQSTQGKEQELKISRYDATGIPEELRFETPTHSISVQIRSYTLAK